MKKFKKNTISMLMMAIVITAATPAAFASTNQTSIENIEVGENDIVVYESNGYTFSMDKDIYASYSEIEKENLEKFYSRLAEGNYNINSRYSEVIEQHDHDYLGPYREKYSYTSTMTDSSGNSTRVKHYKCGEPTAIVCPYERVEFDPLKSIQENSIIVYDDTEYTATISKEEYDKLSEDTKANLDNTYKKIIDIIEKNK